MTFEQLISSINTLLSPRLSAEDIRTTCLNIANFFATQIVDSLPLWNDALTFQTDGTDAGKYCKYEDTNGKKRIWLTKVDDNINNLPPSNPLTTENAYWEEVSPSASSSIQEWSAGLFGPGLVIVHHNHSTEGAGEYKLLEAVRPFDSADIEAEILAGSWERISNKKMNRGEWDDYVNLPVDADQVGTGIAGALEPGNKWYITAAANYDAGFGDGVDAWNAGATIEYLAPGLYKITQ
jgi:hypothetical protein